jgi:hypothetical protein
MANVNVVSEVNVFRMKDETSVFEHAPRAARGEIRDLKATCAVAAR